MNLSEISQQVSAGGEKKPARIIFLGMQSNFSHPSLNALLAAGNDVCAVVLPASQREPGSSALRHLEPPSRRRVLLRVNQSFLHTSVQELAWERRIPLWEVTRLADPAVTALFAEYRPDLICVACFPQRIPAALLRMPRLGTLNVHPALLPANRGPEPLFWTFRLGQASTGVTVHLMDERMDSGPILAQETLAVPDGITYAELEQQTADLGGILLARAAANLASGQAHPRSQDESQASSHPYPSGDDFVIHPAQWDARHVYNFICGVKDWGEPLKLVADPELTLSIEDVLDYSYKPNDMRLYTSERDAWPVRCQRGIVVVKGRPLK